MNSNSLLKLESVNKIYSSEAGLKINVLEGISFEITSSEKGTITSILAPFGAGKSTLLKIISGLLEPTGGDVYFKSSRGKTIPYIPEKPSSFSWLNVSQNIEFGLKLLENNRLKLNQIISLVGLSGYENHYSHNKSIGFRFRISLSRAIAVDPTLILIDDSFRLMKKESRLDIYNLLLDLSLKQKLNFILATTNLFEAIHLSDKIILLSGKPAKIVRKIDIDEKDRPDLKSSDSEKFTKLKNEIEAVFKESESITIVNYSI